MHCPSAGCACCCGAMQVYRECSRSALSFPRLQDRCIDPDIIFGYRIGVCSRARDRWSASMDSTFIQPWIHLPVETIGCSSPTGDQSDGEPAPGACPHAGHADVSAPAQRPNNLAMRLRITDQKKTIRAETPTHSQRSAGCRRPKKASTGDGKCEILQS